MSESYDLNLLAGEPISVTLGQTDYLLPADLPIPTLLKIEALKQRTQGLEDDEEANIEALKELYAEVRALFRIHQPELGDVPIGMGQLYGFIGLVYGGGQDPEAEGPTRAKPAAGTKSSGRKAKTAS
jgi:hypothetical protein